MRRIRLVDLTLVRCSEPAPAERVRNVEAELGVSCVWTEPLVVEAHGLSLLAGHERFEAAQGLGLLAVPALLVEPGDASLMLSWPGFGVDEAAPDGEAPAGRPLRAATRWPVPRCRVPLAVLRERASIGEEVESVTRYPTRSRLLIPFYRRFGAQLGIRTLAAHAVEIESAETLAPHPRLRQMLQSDPSMAALLPGSSARFALGGLADTPFRVRRSGLILLPPTLLEDARALAAAARWGLESAHARDTGVVRSQELMALLRHGIGLLSSLPPESRELFLALLPAATAAELWGRRGRAPSEALCAWLASLVEGAEHAPDSAGRPAPSDASELEAPVEQILIAGGDSRLQLDPGSGQNRYGVPPRPRPEAVHFSSSTASAISDYGFLFCDLLRRDLLTAIQSDHADLAVLRGRATDAIGAEIARMLGLVADDADVALTASGTDAELLSVMVTRAAAAGRPLTNVLISPEETGRGVKLAGSGRFFDDVAASGAPIAKGAAAWPGEEIALCEIAIRNELGAPRCAADIDADFLREGQAALDQGRQVLAHVLAASKTGLWAPSRAAVETLVAWAPDRVDVVVDACQMRARFQELGDYVRRGWMLQVSGSKFLTGPPFSGALVVPRAMRGRARAVGLALAEAPGVGHAADWTRAWAAQMPPARAPASFGPVFRWLPALLEGELLRMLPEDFRRQVFDRFRAAMSARMVDSAYLRAIDVGDDGGEAGADAFSRLSILSFEVLGRRWDGSLAPLDEAACRRLFECLNRDLSAAFLDLNSAERLLARQQCHIGQPVTIGGERSSMTVLRMVLGARFFNIVGHAGPGALEAALESEISDAHRAIAKVELLASRWWRFDEPAGAAA